MQMFRSFSVAFIILAVSSGLFGQVPDRSKVIAGAERAFENASKANAMPAPGCAVGVSLNGESVFEKAFGLAELEHNVPNTPQTIFESGSVAKQFTAAALVLLQQDGKLSIDDPVRKYIPELPDYGSLLTIRHLLNHTAGLRDWGSVMSLTGAGRGERVITQPIALDVIYRQKALDFKPGDEYSYSNSGYQLAAEVVERVSKKKFADFLTERILTPLGMKNTSVRDDYQRIVPNRAQAYSRQGQNGPWRLDMPIMNVYGNGGMLTTVGDWLKWNAMLDSRSMGAPLVEALETQGVLNDGRKIEYALGLGVSSYKGVKEVAHSGATAGYQTYLARYPDRKISIAILCNGSPTGGGRLATALKEELLAPFPTAPDEPINEVKLGDEELQKYAGLWRSEKTHFPDRAVVENGKLMLDGTPLIPLEDGSFRLGSSNVRFTMGPDGRAAMAESNNNGSITKFYAERDWKPTDAELSSFAGDWYSEEAQATFTFALERDTAFIVQRPTTKLPLRPVYKDHFQVQGYMVWFTRDPSGQIDKLHVGGGRMRDMPFQRIIK